jgi:Lon protease-like protein
MVEGHGAAVPDVRTLPVFPLGTVLLPGAALPLHIFEQRYREMIGTCLEATPAEFVVALIKDGDEVVEPPEWARGVRQAGPRQAATPHDVGTVARIVQAGRTEDGRYLIACLGRERVRLRHLLYDRSYLRAEVETLVDHDAAGRAAEAQAVAGRVRESVRRLLIELGEAVSPEYKEQREQLAQAAGAVPSGPADLSFFAPRVLFTASAPEKQRLLEASSVERRLTLTLPLVEREREMTRRGKALAARSTDLKGVAPFSLN